MGEDKQTYTDPQIHTTIIIATKANSVANAYSPSTPTELGARDTSWEYAQQQKQTWKVRNNFQKLFSDVYKCAVAHAQHTHTNYHFQCRKTSHLDKIDLCRFSGFRNFMSYF